ncbi:MAG: hypothetical protein AAB787_01805 [Patescibacteria group bacterium]
MKLEVGNIVTVTLDCMFTNKQGEVVAIVDDGDEDGNIDVKFGSDCDHLFSWNRKGKGALRFKESDLRKDKDYTMEVKAYHLFGAGMFHHLAPLKHPFSLENKCMHEKCAESATNRALVNIWGTVCEVDVCKGHSDWHGNCADSFPWKRPAVA